MSYALCCSKEEMTAIAGREFGLGAGGRCCGESVLTAACAALGVTAPEIVPSIALGFGGGVGLTGRLCGSFSAAIMAIGIATGKTIADYGERKGETFRRAADFLRKCAEKRGGAVDCKALCGLDLTTEAGMDKLVNGGVKDEICLPLVKETAGMLYDELLRIRNGTP